MVAWGAALATVYVAATALAEPTSQVRSAPGTNLVIQTTAGLVAVLVAVIAFGRFRHRRKAADLLLVLGLAQLAAANLLFTTLPLASRASEVPSRTVWAGTLTRLAGSLLVAVAAHLRLRDVDPADRAYADEATVAIVTAALIGVSAAAASRLPTVAVTTIDPARRLWDTAPGVAALTGLAALACVVAAVGFVRGGDREPGDALLGWLAVAFVASAGTSAVTAGSFLSTYSSYVSSADLLKLASYLVLLGGVVREILGYWHDRATIAVADERRRIARDLHDGLAQELAFVVTRTRTLARRHGDDDIWVVCSAAERALDESRRAIAALTSTTDEALDVALAQTAEEVAGRLGTAVTLELDTTVSVPGETKEALLRITREAITNAARHGEATRVHVRLFREGGVRLRVSDNGRGFDTGRTPDNPGKLGLTSMRERAEAMGGGLTVSSRRPGGTDVEILLP